MESPQVDWLGRCGPNQLLVSRTPREIGERFRRLLIVDESILASIFSMDRQFMGNVHDDKLIIYPCKRGRRPQPILTAKLDPVENGTHIVFRIEMNPVTEVYLHLLPFIIVGMSVAFIGVFIGNFGIEIPGPICALPFLLGFLLLFATYQYWQNRVESCELLGFFMSQIERLRADT
jgi:hypothetical protein